MQQWLFDFLDEVKMLASADDVGWRFIDFVQNLGARGAHVWFADGTPDNHWYRTSSATTFAKESLAILDIEYPRKTITKWVARGGPPIRGGWDIESRYFDKDTGDYRTALVQLDLDKRRNAVIIPLPTRGKYGSSGISFHSEMPEERFDKWMEERGSIVIHMAAAAHLAMQERDRAAAALKLSPRELECVKWLSQGLRTKEIAWRLGISSSAVMLYIRNARRKMKVDTRQALVAKAYLAGLIS